MFHTDKGYTNSYPIAPLQGQERLFIEVIGKSEVAQKLAVNTHTPMNTLICGFELFESSLLKAPDNVGDIFQFNHLSEHVFPTEITL